MITPQDCVTTRLQLTEIDVLEIVTFLMIFLIEYVVQKTKDLNLNVSNIITGINESKTLTEHVSCQCTCKFDGRKCNLNQKWNNNKCRCEFKNPREHHM